jgi:hypothetical protein
MSVLRLTPVFDQVLLSWCGKVQEHLKRMDDARNFKKMYQANVHQK